MDKPQEMDPEGHVPVLLCPHPDLSFSCPRWLTLLCFPSTALCPYHQSTYLGDNHLLFVSFPHYTKEVLDAEPMPTFLGQSRAAGLSMHGNRWVMNDGGGGWYLRDVRSCSLRIKGEYNLQTQTQKWFQHRYNLLWNGKGGNPKYFLHRNEISLTIFKKQKPIQITCGERHFRPQIIKGSHTSYWTYWKYFLCIFFSAWRKWTLVLNPTTK